MTNWEDLNLIFDNLVKYFTGSYELLAIFLISLVLMVFLARGIDARYAVTYTLPLIGAFVSIGWFGPLVAAQWIVNATLLIVAIFYGSAMVKILT